MKNLTCYLFPLFVVLFLTHQSNAQYILTDDDVVVSKGSIMSTSYTKGGAIVIPSVLDGQKVTSIGMVAFKNCSLTSIVFPASLKTIDSFAFQDNSLSNLVFPNSLTQIGDYAFYGNKLDSFNLPICTSDGSWKDSSNKSYDNGANTTDLYSTYTYR